jgi:hypothetical protein
VLSHVPKKSPSETSDKRKTEGQHEKEGKIEEERQTDTRGREEGERKPVESLAGEREHRVPNISALRYTSGVLLLLRFKRTLARDFITG